MANVLKMAKKHAIIGLLENGWSYRRIARELCVDRKTVARYDKLHRSNLAISTPGSWSPGNPNAAISTPGSDCPGNPKPAISTPGSLASPGRDSRCKPFAGEVQKKLDRGLSAQRIFQDLCEEHGFTGSYSSVKRYVRSIGTTMILPFRRLELAGFDLPADSSCSGSSSESFELQNGFYGPFQGRSPL